MPIDQFDTARFESALPAGRWEYEGFVGNERVYRITPTGAPDGFAIRIRSSIGASGIADEAGEDSIRCMIVRRNADGDWIPYGGKANRWTDRRNGWEDRLGKVLLSLKSQVLRLLPCPACGVVVVPFTSTTDANKRRPFVCCKNEACKKPHWEWTDVPPRAPATPAADAPECPKCKGPMCRMVGTADRPSKGWRCNAAGNRWLGKGKGPDGEGWSVCAGVVWDRDRKAAPVADESDDTPPASKPATPEKPAPVAPPAPVFVPPPPAAPAPASKTATPTQLFLASVRKAMATLAEGEVNVTPALLAQLRGCVSPEALVALVDLLTTARDA